MNDWPGQNPHEFDEPFPFEANEPADDHAPIAGDDIADHAIPDDVVDAFLRDTDPDASSADSIDDFFATQRAVDALRRPVTTPDHTSEILDAVARQRGWLSAPARRRVVVGRYAAAGLLLGLVAGALISQRLAPDALEFVDRPTPVTDFVESGTEFRANAAGTFDDIGKVLGIIPTEPVAEPPASNNESSIVVSITSTEARTDDESFVRQLNGRIATMTISDPRFPVGDLPPGITIVRLVEQNAGCDDGPEASSAVGSVNPEVHCRYTWSGPFEPPAETHEDLLESISR